MWLALQDLADVAEHVSQDTLHFALKTLETASWMHMPMSDGGKPYRLARIVRISRASILRFSAWLAPGLELSGRCSDSVLMNSAPSSRVSAADHSILSSASSWASIALWGEYACPTRH